MNRENEVQNQSKRNYALPVSILVSALIISGAWIYTTSLKTMDQNQSDSSVASEEEQLAELEEKVLPSEGVALPVVWGDLGAKLVNSGTINEEKFRALYEQRGTFDSEYEDLLLGQNKGQLKITKENAGYLLNLFWALGLASKNPILENGEMANPAYGGAENFASTAGWTLAAGDTMDHYNKHNFFDLTVDEQALVDRVSRGIYRPCCGNSTYFPDCNHGMAMLGLLELMSSQGASEQDMWDAALAVNSYWFRDTYMTIAMYMQSKGVSWEEAKSQEVLGVDYSSASGFRRIASQVEPLEEGGGGGCSV